MDAAGEVVRKLVAEGTKSEHPAVVLVTGGEEYLLRRAGGNAFADPSLDQLVGKRIRATGTLAGVTLILDGWVEE
jgi:hypothetical protein